MSIATASTACTVCAEPLDNIHEACRGCGAALDQRELIQAIDYTLRRFAELHNDGRLTAIQHRDLRDYYEQARGKQIDAARGGYRVADGLTLPSRLQCWQCKSPCGNNDEVCPACGVPVDKPAVLSMRIMRFFHREVGYQEQAGRLPLSVAHSVRRKVSEKTKALEANLWAERIPFVTAVTEEPPVLELAQPPRRPLLEVILDPKSIQWLLIVGAGLLVIGLVIWLITVGIFNNPIAIAVALGVANGAVLAGGWALIKATRYKTAGQALTLLACLVMPLNLWFYHANDLITASGHLWAPALIMSGLYAVSAILLRDRVFVYVLMGGLTLSGLLILSDIHGSLFFTAAPHCTFLVVLGVVAIALERAFAPGAGPFQRHNFGMAFFWSGQAALGAGLIVLLCAQVYGWILPVFMGPSAQEHLPFVITEPATKMLALGLVLTGMIVYLYSDIVVRRIGVYIYLAVGCLLWAEILVINLIPGLTLGVELVIVSLAATALIANLMQMQFARDNKVLARAGMPLGVFLSLLPVFLGALLHLRATYQGWNDLWGYEISWWYVGAMALAALSCRVGAHLHRATTPIIAKIYFFGAAGATLLGAAGLLHQLGVHDWSIQAMLLMAIPIAYVIAARLYHDDFTSGPLLLTAHVATGVIAVAVIASGLQVTPRVFEMQLITSDVQNLLIAAFFAEAVVFYLLTAILHKQEFSIFPMTVAAAACMWQLLQYLEVLPEFYTLAFALLGLALLVVYRMSVLEQMNLRRFASAAFHAGNVLQTVAFGAAVLMTLFKLLQAGQRPMELTMTFALPILAVQALVGAWLVQQQEWRRWYFLMAVAYAVLALVVLAVSVDLPLWRKAELVAVATGVILLIIGHVGWRREQESRSDLVSLSMALGSIAVAAPLTLALLGQRAAVLQSGPPAFLLADELAALAAGILLLSTGIVCRIIATTLSGAIALAIYLVTLLMYVRMPEILQTTAVWMVIGGGAIFGAGLLLSVYRDRLLSLPDRIKRREGIFRLLTWR